MLRSRTIHPTSPTIPQPQRASSKVSDQKRKRRARVLLTIVQKVAFAGCFICIGYNYALFQNESQGMVLTSSTLVSSSSTDTATDGNDSASEKGSENENTDGSNRHLMEIKRPICNNSRHLFLGGEDRNGESPLTRAYWQAEKFHSGGGNLKAVETYLNAQIDVTYEMMNFTFTQKGRHKPLGRDKSIAEKIEELLRAKDVHKRGGYDQRQYPGSLESSNTNYFGQRKVKKGMEWKRQYFDGGSRQRLDVVEPHHSDKWAIGLGPKFDICKSVDKIRRANQSYGEDKFMCSFEEVHSEANTNTDTNQGNTDVDDTTGNEGIKYNKEREQQQQQQRCEMISIGSNGQWGFEETIAQMTNCVTHTFDCTIENPQKPDAETIHFYPICVSATNMKIEDREFMTYAKILEQTGMTTPPALFKMDVEGFEYDVLSKMLEEALETGTMHLLPSQISVELHYATRMFDVPWMQRYLQASEIAMFMGTMYKRGGYLPVNIVTFGRRCFSCAEVLFVRAFCD